MKALLHIAVIIIRKNLIYYIQDVLVLGERIIQT